ncbi:MAG: chloride channel protein [Dehalococcoidia bacterium]
MTLDSAEVPTAPAAANADPGILSGLRPAASGFAVGVVVALVAVATLGVFKLISSSAALWRFESGILPIVVLAPAIGGALVGVGRRWWGNGYDRLLSGRPPGLRHGLGQFGLALVTIVFGGVAGREEPSIGLTATAVRRFGLLARQRTITPHGIVSASVAGGLAAAFGTPFAGFLFAIETVVGRRAGGDLIAVIVAAGVGAIIGRLTGVAAALPAGASPAAPGGWIAIVIVAVTALVVGLAATSLIGLVLQTLRRFGVPFVAAPAVGGLIVGLLALVSPAFAAIEPIPPALLGDDPLWLVTAAGRTGALVATFGFGGVGGVIGPIVGIGQALGAGAAGLLAPVLPGASAATLAVVGAVVILAAVVRAPFAGAVLALEFGADPLLVVVVAALAWGAAEIARRAEPWSIYRVLDADEERPHGSLAAQLLSTTLVRDLMTPDYPVIASNATLGDASLIIQHGNEEAPIVDGHGELAGVLGPHDIEIALLTTSRDSLAIAWARREFPTLVPYQSIAQALEEPGIETVAAIPVVDPRDRFRLVGMLRRARVLEELGLLAAPDHPPLPPTHQALPVLEIAIREGSPWAGKRLRDLRLPRDAYLALLQRGDERFPLRGDSLLRPGDRVIGFAPEPVCLRLAAQAEPGSDQPAE